MSFGGMSTPWGIYFYGENYESSIIKGKLKISKNETPGKHIIYIMLAMYLILDVTLVFSESIFKIIGFIFSNITENPYFPQEQLISIQFNFIIPSWVWECLGYFFLILQVVFIIWFMYNVRGYHGAEHKAILAAIKGDVSNARKSPRITSHCGSNLLFPYLIFYSIFAFMGYYIIGTPMILSVVTYQKIPYMRRYLSYVGQYVQRVTTQEPTEKQLKEAQKGIMVIIEAEEIRVYRRIKPFFIQIPMR